MLLSAASFRKCVLLCKRYSHTSQSNSIQRYRYYFVSLNFHGVDRHIKRIGQKKHIGEYCSYFWRVISIQTKKYSNREEWTDKFRKCLASSIRRIRKVGHDSEVCLAN